jgi:hypothetical protein
VAPRRSKLEKGIWHKEEQNRVKEYDTRKTGTSGMNMAQGREEQ